MRKLRDSYSVIRGIIGNGSHPETGNSSAGRISVSQAQAMGLSVGQIKSLVEDDANYMIWDQPGVERPKNQNSHIGVHMPTAAKPAADTAPVYAYGSEGELLGWIVAQTVPVVGERQERGEVPNYDVSYIAQRVTDHGVRKTFESESEAKSYVSNGVRASWYAARMKDPWESMTPEAKLEKAQLIAESILEASKPKKFEKCVKDVKAKNRSEGKPEEGTEGGKGNPWAICHKSTGESLSYGFEDWLNSIDECLAEGIGMEDIGDGTYFNDVATGKKFAVAVREGNYPVIRPCGPLGEAQSVSAPAVGLNAQKAAQFVESLHTALKEGEKGKKLKSGELKGGKSEPSSGDEPGEGGRFKALKKKLAAREALTVEDIQAISENAELYGDLEKVLQEYQVKNPGALAAAIGRAKYGKEKFQKMASAGRKKKGKKSAGEK